MPFISGGGGGAGYTPTTKREKISGSNVSIANGDSAALTWDTSSGPDSLLDLTVPAVPTVKAAGIYAVSAEVTVPNAMTAGGSYSVEIDLDVSGTDGSVVTRSASAAASNSLEPTTAVCLVFYVPLGGSIQVFVGNNDGAASRNFSLVAAVQRIT